MASVLVHLTLGLGVLWLVRARPALVTHVPQPRPLRPAGFTRVTVLASTHAPPQPEAPAVRRASARATRTLQALPTLTAMEATPTSTQDTADVLGAVSGDEIGATAGVEGGAAAPTNGPPSAGGVSGLPGDGAGDLSVLSALVHAQLAAVADRCYPPAARRFHQTGSVGLRFCLDAAGGVAQAEVRAPSGAGPLDGAALECVLPTAAPFPPQTANHCFDVAVRFGLR